MLPFALRSLWNEPAIANPPRRLWIDWALVGALLVGLVVELFARPDLEWPAFAFALSVVCVVALLWRRTLPLAVTVVSFGAQTLTDMAEVFGANESAVMFTTACVLILPFSLARWASGRHIVLGLAFFLACHAARETVNDTAIWEASLQTLFWLFPAALGASMRLLADARSRERQQIRERERQQLARDLHDTVAHHVSAIAIQAELGLAMVESAPGDALALTNPLEAIAREAAESLAEMRLTVGALRDDEVALRPQNGVADIEALADTWVDGPPITVQLSGDLTDLPPAVDTAIYRLAQECMTNAVRHAKGATKVTVQITGHDHDVSLRVVDDGRAGAPGSTPGFGLVGMHERAKLLGGTLKVHAEPGAGWDVHALLPRTGGVR